MQPRPRVILRHCDSYDPERIRSIVREGLDVLGLKPHGRTLVKPNLVAAGPLFQHAYTRPEFMQGVLLALKDRAGFDLEELAVGERCGITMPTRLTFKESGVGAVCDELGVKRYHFEEEPQVEIPLTHATRLRDYVFTPEPVAKADFFVNAPKFKAHPWTTVTFSIKAYIGIQDDRHRLIDHDHRLNEKIADLQHVLQPQFICIDAITAGQGRMLTPEPFPMNLIIMGENQVAFDSICSRIIGIDPSTVDHLRLAHEGGFGPLEFEAIELLGDVSFDEAFARGRTFKSGLVRVEKYFEGTNIAAYAGPPPDSPKDGYCWGGCPGAIEEAIEILRSYDEQCDARMRRLHVVFGAYQGPIDAKPGEKVVFVGDCVSWKGELAGRAVEEKSVYQDRSSKDPRTATHEDVFAKLRKVAAQLNASKGQPSLRLVGCPVSVAEQVLFLTYLSRLRNPFFDPDNALEFNKAYFAWKASVFSKRVRGIPYQRNGSTLARGASQPQVR